MYIRTRKPHPWGAAATKAPATHAKEHDTIASLHQLPMPVPAVYARPLGFQFLKHFSFISKEKEGEGKKKVRGEEERHNNQRHTHTVHSAHAGEQAPP